MAEIAAATHADGRSVICFTGYRFETLQQRNDFGAIELIRQIDLLIDGPYIKAQHSTQRPWVGSDNQRYLFLSKRFAHNISAASNNKWEIRIAADGSVAINGMGDAIKIQEILQNEGFCQYE